MWGVGSGALIGHSLLPTILNLQTCGHNGEKSQSKTLTPGLGLTMSTISDPHDPLAHPVQPNFTIPKVLGILNIAFGALLLMWGLWSLVQLAITPWMTSIIGAQQQKAQVVIEAGQDAQLEALREAEAAAETEEEKEQIRAQRKMLEQAPQVTMNVPDVSKMLPTTNPRVFRWTIANTATGLLLNLLLVIAGIGLLMRRSWGRTLTLWLAGLKIIRLLIGQTYWAIVCVPIIAKQMSVVIESMTVGVQGAGATPVPTPQFGIMYTVMYTAQAVFMVVLGSIYPVICLWLLNKRSAKAVFNQPPPDGLLM